MSKLRIFTASAFTLALALGVWTLAAVSFSDTSASFSDGDVLQASELNALFNAIDQNFADAQTQINANEAALDQQVSRGGDSMSGRFTISADAESSGSGDPASTFSVTNTSADTGSAAVFNSNNDSDAGAVSVKQNGAGPALTLKSNGGGPLISGAGSALVTFVVEENGSISIGDMGPDGSGDPTLRLDAEAGTVTNGVGSGLPLAFGSVSSTGTIQAGTGNFSVSLDGDDFVISIDGESYHIGSYATVVTPNDPALSEARTDSANGDLIVELYDAGGTQDTGSFHFVTFKPGN